MGIASYRELKVWQMGMNIAVECYFLTREFPKSEIYGMTSQIRRASASIPANIAEGYGRQYQNEYLQFLHIFNGSLKELETHLLLAARVELTTKEAIVPILHFCEEEGKMLTALIRKLKELKKEGSKG